MVSAALNPNGVPRRALAVARSSGTIALSAAVFGEVTDVLARSKFARVLTDERRREVLEMLSAAALWVEPTETIADCRDAKDNHYLELAHAAQAIVIISGDEDLLVLNPCRGVKVLRPARFHEEIQGMQGECSES